MGSARRLLFLFFDGIGHGAGSPRKNPVAAAALPNLSRLTGAGGLPRAPLERPRLSCGLIDATLQTPGLPQSGTGHASLFAGFNAARAFGRHFGPWVPTTVRDRFARDNILTRARQEGFIVRFANAVPEGSLVRRPIGPPLAAFHAGIALPDGAALVRGEAVASGFTNDRWQQAFPEIALPVVTPRSAGHRVGELALEAELTLFAHYDLDLVGHRGTFDEAVEALERVDQFVGGVLDAFPLDEGLLLMTSDHGNIEAAARSHTRNPVPLIAAGAGAQRFVRVRAIPQVASSVLDALRGE